MQLVNPNSLTIGQSYLEVYLNTRFNLFTVLSSKVENNVVKYMLEDYYSSTDNLNETTWYRPEDLSDTVYQLPEPNLSFAQIQLLYPEFFI